MEAAYKLKKDLLYGDLFVLKGTVKTESEWRKIIPLEEIHFDRYESSAFERVMMTYRQQHEPLKDSVFYKLNKIEKSQSKIASAINTLTDRYTLFEEVLKCIVPDVLNKEHINQEYLIRQLNNVKSKIICESNWLIELNKIDKECHIEKINKNHIIVTKIMDIISFLENNMLP